MVQLLCQCVEEVGFDWCVQSGDVIGARRHVFRLQSLDRESAMLRSILPPCLAGIYCMRAC